MARDIDDEVYELVVFEKKITDLLNKTPEDNPKRPKLISDLKRIQQELSNIKPEQSSALSHGFQQGTVFGQEGKIKGGARELVEMFGGPESDYSSRVRANELVREAAKKEHPKTYMASEYVLPMLNPLDPLAAATSGIIKLGAKGLEAYKGAKVAGGLTKATGELVDKFPTKTINEIPELFAKEQKIVESGLTSSGKEVEKQLMKEGLRDSAIRGGVSSSIVSASNYDSDESLTDQTMDIVSGTAFGALTGMAIPKGLNLIGSGLKGGGKLINNTFGQFFSRMPDKMVKQSLAKTFNLTKEELSTIPNSDINWLRQYIQLANSKGQNVIGGNKDALIAFTDRLSKELSERNQKLIGQSANEGKSIHLEPIIKAVKSQFKGKDEKKLVDLTVDNFAQSFPPSRERLYHRADLGPEDFSGINFKGPIEKVRKSIEKEASDPESVLYGTAISGPTMSAKDLYEFQKELSRRIDDLYALGKDISPSDSKQLNVYKKLIDGMNYAYKYLDPEVALKDPSLSLRKNASDIRKMISLKEQLLKGMNRKEAAEIEAKNQAMEKVYWGGIPFAAAYYATGNFHHGMEAMAAGLAAKYGAKKLSKLGMSDATRYNIGTGLSGHATSMLGGAAARPMAYGLDLYKTAKEASPPEPPPIEMPEEEPVEDFSGFGSSSEWIRKQLGK